TSPCTDRRGISRAENPRRRIANKLGSGNWNRRPARVWVRPRGSEEPDEVLLDLRASRRVRRVLDAALPHLDRLVLEAGLLVEDREVLERGKVLRIQLDRPFELAHAVVDLPLLPVEE